MSPLRLLRACHPLPALAVTAVSGLLALGMGHSLRGAALVAGTVGLSQLAVGWANDAIDAGRDLAVGRADKPLAAEPGGRRTVAIAAVLATAATVAAALAWGWPASGWFLLALVSAQLYNWPLKGTPASIVPYLVSFAALIAFIGAARPGSPPAPGWLLLAAALLTGAAHLLNAVPDLADDAATGVRGLPQRLGARRSLLLATVLLIAAMAVLIAGARPPLWAALVVSVTAVAMIPLGRYADPRTAFRALLGLALVDVLVLVVAGVL
ncbi:UbiA family prenyltransferase [Catellatospora sp. KI3]|uniref:UbiA family prenyltransferase n=1 Tax=Catellatospora sp. KI3 TaxID=3041620 RepID=UPI0024830B27|nr:UbiA family prenyltransferase [Catellatospora sp. KI3]MDI1465122.1 UbiA family prenyltransferase [Catellatospora sp. KI3]